MADADTDRKRYVMKLRALRNKEFQLKQHFERIDHKLDVVDPEISAAREHMLDGDSIPALEYIEGSTDV